MAALARVGHPFVLLYFSCDADLACGYTVCAPFQKIVQMGRAKGAKGTDGKKGAKGAKGVKAPMVYMIYSDGPTACKIARARDIRRYIEDGVRRVFGVQITVREHKLIYWDSGTHYFTPLEGFETREAHIAALQGIAGPKAPKAPKAPNVIYVVGEAVSAHQGWCEGALESVEAMLAALTERKRRFHRGRGLVVRCGAGA